MHGLLKALSTHRRAVLITLGAAVGLAVAVTQGIAWHRAQRHQAAIKRIVALLDLPADAKHQAVFDAVRGFVNDHSQHAIDAEFYADWPYPHLLAEKVVAHAEGTRTEPAHMECSTRSALTAGILNELGHTTRRIDVYDAGVLNSHTFLEVLNPETRRWETQDPDYDVAWRKTDGGERVSITDASGDLARIEPCGRAGCGWTIASRENTKAEALKELLDFIVVRWPDKELRYTIYTPRAEPDRIYSYRSKEGRFCDVLAKNCRDGFFPVEAAPLAE